MRIFFTNPCRFLAGVEFRTPKRLSNPNELLRCSPLRGRSHSKELGLKLLKLSGIHDSAGDITAPVVFTNPRFGWWMDAITKHSPCFRCHHATKASRHKQWLR